MSDECAGVLDTLHAIKPVSTRPLVAHLAYLPQAQMQSLIVELRSLTLGVGYFHKQYDDLQEVPEKLAELEPLRAINRRGF